MMPPMPAAPSEPSYNRPPESPTIATVQSTPSYGAPPNPYGAAEAVPAPKSSSKTPLIIALAAVLLIGVGVGAFFLLGKKGESTANANSANAGGNANTENANAGGTTAEGVEAVQYWLEIEGAGPGGGPARVAPVVPLASGQSFKFHFLPRRDGFIYVVGPGEDGKPMTFLTEVPVADSGLESNEVESGTEFAFPEDEEGAEHWITLDKKPSTETYTVIFAPKRLSSPAFLTKEAGRELSQLEQQELEDFRAKYKANAPATNVLNGGGTEPLVSVKVPQAAVGDPVIFDVRVEHK
jgi:hypothetical protein